MIDQTLKARIMTEALRAPTVHNVQPWIIEFRGDDIVIHDELSRTLKVGDPELHDHEVSLGAVIESIDLILKSKGLGIAELHDLKNAATGETRERCRLVLGVGYKKDPLVDQILRRKSYRGKFTAATDQDRAAFTQKFTTANSAVIVDDLKNWAGLYDRCAAKGNEHRPLQEELYHWLRLTAGHKDYKRDGLNREALAISAPEGWAANLLLKPSVYAFLAKLGMAGTLVSEAPQINSGTGLLVVFKAADATPMQNGRNFMRLWLTIAQEGFSACPVSSIVDMPEGRAALEEKFKGKQILNVLRVGRIDADKVYTSPRRPVSETVRGAYEV